MNKKIKFITTPAVEAKYKELCEEYMNDNPMPEMTEDEVAEIKRRMDDCDNPIRYYIVSTLLMEMFYDIQSDCWSSCRKSSTGFKRKSHAELIQSEMQSKDHTIITEYEG